MKKIVSMILIGLMTAVLAGCGQKAATSTNSYNQAVEILDVIWDSVPEENKFACFGGNVSSPEENKPGTLLATDTDSLGYMALWPESLNGNVDDAATLIHMMNANTFTGVCIKVKGVKADEIVNTVEERITTNQFMCGFPEKLVIATSGDYIFYAFGATDIISDFLEGVNKVEGAAVKVDRPLE